MKTGVNLSRRIIAFLFDSVISGSFFFLLLTFLPMNNLNTFLLLRTTSPFIIYLVYFGSLEYWKGFTPGKKLTGLKVVNLDGGSITAWQSFIRNIARLFDTLPGFGIGIMAIILSENNQRVGDWAAGTKVVRK